MNIDLLPISYYRVTARFKGEYKDRVHYIKARHDAEALIKFLGSLSEGEKQKKYQGTTTQWVSPEEVASA